MTGSSTGHPLHVMTWNVQHASPARSARQVAWLTEQPDADAVVLTEVSRRASMDALADGLNTAGYTVHVPSSAGERLVVIATRIGVSHRVDRLYTGRLPHRAISVGLELSDGARCGLIGLYVPSRGPKDRRNVDKRAFQADVAAALPELVGHFAGVPVVVGGDLNVVEPDHVPHHQVFSAWEYDFYHAFAKAGLADTFRHLYPDAVEHSWFGRANRGYRFDHLFCTTAHVSTVTDSTYVHEPRLLGLSDHAAHTTTLLVHQSG